MTSTLADHLRALPDDGLGALLQLRPDLVVPVPPTSPPLASRAQGRVSVARALDGLDQFTLEVLDGLRLRPRRGGTAAWTTLLTLATEAGVGAGPGARGRRPAAGPVPRVRPDERAVRWSERHR